MTTNSAYGGAGSSSSNYMLNENNGKFLWLDFIIDILYIIIEDELLLNCVNEDGKFNDTNASSY